MKSLLSKGSCIYSSIIVTQILMFCYIPTSLAQPGHGKDTTNIDPKSFTFRENYPTKLTFTDFPESEINSKLLLLYFKQMPDSHVLQSKLSRLKLQTENRKLLPTDKTNNTQNLLWVYNSAGTKFNDQKLSAIRAEFGGDLGWVHVVYQKKNSTEGGFVPNPKLIYIKTVIITNRLEVEFTRVGLEQIGQTDTHKIYRLRDNVEHTVFPIADFLRRKFPNEQDVYFFSNIPLNRLGLSSGGTLERNDPYFDDQRATFNVLRILQAWQNCTATSLVKVAVIDEGFNINASDISFSGGGRLDDLSNPMRKPEPPNNMSKNHGTAVASIIGATQDNEKGIAGILSNTLLIPYGFHLGEALELDLGIRHAVNSGTKVINISCTSPDWNSGPIAGAIEFASRNGVLICASTGNDGKNQFNMPARHPLVIAIGGSKKNSVHNNSNGGEFQAYSRVVGVSVVAPYTIVSINYEGKKICFTGTSASTPVVSAIIAMIWRECPALTANQMRMVIETTADKIGSGYLNNANFPNGTHHSHLGYGRINADKALKAARLIVAGMPGN